MSTSLFTRRLRWTDVARLLDVGYESAVLPALVTCPLCQGHALRVYEDQAVRGAWFHCGACGAGGDGVSFAATVWKTDVAGAVTRLVAAGLLPAGSEAAVPAYLAGVAARRQRVADFWATASRHLPGWESPGAAALARAVGVNLGIPEERWRVGMATLVGAAPARAVEQTFNPAGLAGGGGGGVRNRRVFVGRGWRDVLVLPYYSAAGRISGFGLVGRGGGPGDRVFAPVRSNELVARRDAGLYAPHAAEGHPTVVAVPDDVLALRLHSRHFSTSGRFLGLVAWTDDGTNATGRPCWQQLNGKRVVHWVRDIDAAVVRQAFFFDADVSTAGPEHADREAFLAYCRQLDPPDLLRRVARAARPWRYALADWVREAAGGPVEVLVARLRAYGIDPHEVARSLPDREAADRLHDLSGPARAVPGVQFATFAPGTVEARPDGWYYRCRRRLGAGDRPVTRGTDEGATRISDFTLAIRQIRVLPDREVYECDVFHRGRCHPVDIDPALPVARQLVRAGVGLVYVAPKWVNKVLQVAAAFADPVVVREC